MERLQGDDQPREARHLVRRAVSAFADPRALSAPDLVDPERWIVIGRSAFRRVLFVAHTEQPRSGRIRIISARKASPTQRRKYEEA